MCKFNHSRAFSGVHGFSIEMAVYAAGPLCKWGKLRGPPTKRRPGGLTRTASECAGDGWTRYRSGVNCVLSVWIHSAFDLLEIRQDFLVLLLILQQVLN